MILGKKATSKALFYYLLGCGILCLFLALATIVAVIAWIAVMGPALFVDGPYVSVIAGIFIATMTFGGVWFTIRFSNWKKAPENLVYIDEENNLVIYTRKGEVKIQKDDIDSIYGIPESLFIKYFMRDYGELHVHTTDKKYKVQFVEGVTPMPHNIFNALGLPIA